MTFVDADVILSRTTVDPILSEQLCVVYVVTLSEFETVKQDSNYQMIVSMDGERFCFFPQIEHTCILCICTFLVVCRAFVFCGAELPI